MNKKYIALVGVIAFFCCHMSAADQPESWRNRFGRAWQTYSPNNWRLPTWQSTPELEERDLPSTRDYPDIASRWRHWRRDRVEEQLPTLPAAPEDYKTFKTNAIWRNTEANGYPYWVPGFDKDENESDMYDALEEAKKSNNPEKSAKYNQKAAKYSSREDEYENIKMDIRRRYNNLLREYRKIEAEQAFQRAYAQQQEQRLNTPFMTPYE